MRLLEFEAKRRLAPYGIAVPRGDLWPAVPGGVKQFVVKAQVPRGGRGKIGAIVFASNEHQAGVEAVKLLAGPAERNDVTNVLVEERIEVARELYLAVVVDRDARAYALLASPEGGVDVESVRPDRILKVLIDPLLGLRPYAIRRLHTFLGLPHTLRQALTATVTALVAAAMREDAQLVEINPLALTLDDRLVALDAKMVLDDNARFRHSDWQSLTMAEEGSSVDRRIGAAGATGIEINAQGCLVGVVSGAGLMMATLDWLTAAGAPVKYMVDLGGTPLADRRGLVPIFAALADLQPAAVFINAYFQTARADDFASAIVEAQQANPIPGRIVVRLKGRSAEAARGILAPFGFEMHEDLVGGLRAGVVAAKSVKGAS